MTAIIFGANGQDGYYLANALREEGFQVIGVSRRGDFLRTDITSLNEVAELIKTHEPSFIFHFAANSTTRHDAMFENHETICTGTLNILEAVRLHSPKTKVFISGSALQFKNHGKPVKESDPFEARDPYAVSRIQSVYAARYFRTLGLKVYVGYFFNHDSPRRSERHVAMKIAAAARRIAAGSKEILEIGDMSVVKEWSFAGDLMRALLIFIKQEVVFEVNLGSGEGHSIREWAEACFNSVDLDYRDHVKEDSDFKAEYKSLTCDPHLLFSLGYKPQTSFISLAKMMVNDR